MFSRYVDEQDEEKFIFIIFNFTKILALAFTHPICSAIFIARTWVEAII